MDITLESNNHTNSSSRSFWTDFTQVFPWWEQSLWSFLKSGLKSGLSVEKFVNPDEQKFHVNLHTSLCCTLAHYTKAQQMVSTYLCVHICKPARSLFILWKAVISRWMYKLHHFFSPPEYHWVRWKSLTFPLDGGGEYTMSQEAK